LTVSTSGGRDRGSLESLLMEPCLNEVNGGMVLFSFLFLEGRDVVSKLFRGILHRFEVVVLLNAVTHFIPSLVMSSTMGKRLARRIPVCRSGARCLRVPNVSFRKL
jgi:hypothetical protein